MFLSGRRGIKQCGALLGVAETGVAPTPTSKNPSTAKSQNKKYLLYSLFWRRQYTRKKEISIAYDTSVFYTESVWLSDDKTFCIVTQAGSSGVKNTLAFVKSTSGKWEKCDIYEADSKKDNIFVIFKTDALGHTWRVACLAVKEASESALTLSPSVAYPAKERFGLSLENELHMTGYGIGDIELPFVQEEVAS